MPCFLTIALFLFSHILITSATLNCSTDSFSSLLPSNATVTFTSQVTNFGTIQAPDVNISIPWNVTRDALPICALTIRVQSSANTSFNTGILLPNNWNGRLMATGNPGFGGGIRGNFLGTQMLYGPAVTLSTDTGHIGAPNNVSFAIDGGPDSAIDWAYRSLHESTVLGKQIAKAFYGDDVGHSYYTACSNGGRQGLKEVQMFPDDYDGVVAGAPPWQITHTHPWALQLGLWNLPSNSSNHIPSYKFDAIAQNMLDQCDGQDGLVDGIVSQPYACNFSSAMLMCNQTTTNTSACLSAEEINTLSLMYNDWQATNGSMIYPRFPLSASASRYGEVSDAPDHFGLEYIEGFVFNNTNWDWTTFKGQQTVEYIDTLNTADAAALSMDLSSFKANGGKLIMYHGLSDTTIPTGSSIEYYQGVNSTMKLTTESLQDFFKLYVIPGMGHCGESQVAPYFIAAAGQVVNTAKGNSFSVPGYVDPKHDVFLAMMNWVENGTAPEDIIASKWNNNTVENGLLMQRPICPYPQKAVYSGQGDWHDPSTWSCADGDTVQFPAQNGSVGTVQTMKANCGNDDGCRPQPNSGHSTLTSLGSSAMMLVTWVLLGVLGIGCLI